MVEDSPLQNCPSKN